MSCLTGWITGNKAGVSTLEDFVCKRPILPARSVDLISNLGIEFKKNHGLKRKEDTGSCANIIRLLRLFGSFSGKFVENLLDPGRRQPVRSLDHSLLSHLDRVHYHDRADVFP